jgi:hypothetical protein
VKNLPNEAKLFPDPEKVGKLAVGDLVETSYGSGPYRVEHISGTCACRAFVDELNDNKSPLLLRKHVHITCSKPGERDNYYLNGYDPKTLRSVWNGDRITVIK